MSNRGAPPGTQSVLRAVRLLKALAGRGRDMDLAEITRETGLARTTTHRLLSALESEGLVTRSHATGAYRLGPAAIAIGSQALRANDLRALARPFLEQLAESTGETASLEIPADGKMLIVDEVLGRQLVTTSASIGTAWAIHATSTGKAFLSGLDGKHRREALSGRLERFTSQTQTSREELERTVATVRERGYAIAIDELSQGFSAVAAPVLDADSRPIGALSVGAPTGRLTQARLHEFGRAVAEAAGLLSGQLGHR